MNCLKSIESLLDSTTTTEKEIPFFSFSKPFTVLSKDDSKFTSIKKEVEKRASVLISEIWWQEGYYYAIYEMRTNFGCVNLKDCLIQVKVVGDKYEIIFENAERS